MTNVIACIVCGKNAIARRPYCSVINRDKVQGGRHVRTNYSVQEGAGIYAGAGARSMALPADEFTWYAVGKAVNRVGVSNPALIDPIALDAPADTEDKDSG